MLNLTQNRVCTVFILVFSMFIMVDNESDGSVWTLIVYHPNER